jgi:cytochrome P450
MAFAEALRLYPPAWILGRRTREEDSIGGWKLPKMSIVLISQWLMHRDPRHWEDAACFRPERFAPEAEASRKPFTYFPFSAGPRGCIGEGFAWMEGVLLLAAFAQKWRFELVEGHEVLPQPQITLRPKFGIKVKLRRRA